MPPLLSKYQVLLHQDEEGGFTVVCPSIPGCISQGNTRDEALANIREAILLCLESVEGGMEPPWDADNPSGYELVAVGL